MFAQTISFSAAFMAGLLSFFSPCILPLVPGYFTFITGYSLDELTHGDKAAVRRRVVFSTLFFVLGFSFVFIFGLGILAALLGGVVDQSKEVLRVAGGLLLILLGVHVSGLFRLKFLDVEKRLHMNKRPVHFLGAFLVGMAFGAGWSPCIGPILGGIFALAVNMDTVMKKFLLLFLYSAGLAVPFLIMSFFINYILVFLRRAVRVLKYVNAVAGILLAVLGVLLVTDNLYFYL